VEVSFDKEGSKSSEDAEEVVVRTWHGEDFGKERPWGLNMEV
jgi:hypothetical protein